MNIDQSKFSRKLLFINQFNFLYFRKISDKFSTAAPKIPNIVPADGALSAAVDVMSFTHDIVMLNDSTIGVTNPKSTENKLVKVLAQAFAETFNEKFLIFSSKRKRSILKIRCVNWFCSPSMHRPKKIDHMHRHWQRKRPFCSMWKKYIWIHLLVQRNRNQYFGRQSSFRFHRRQTLAWRVCKRFSKTPKKSSIRKKNESFCKCCV